MSPGRRPSALTGRDAIVVAAERMIALRGLSVPARDIAVAAGQRNNSAVQYHFGSREDLVVAVIEHRAPALEARRMERLIEAERSGRGDDTRALVSALVTPLLEAPLLDGSWYYGRFLEQVRVLPDALGRATLDAHRASAQLITERLRVAMPEMDDAAREQRIQIFGTALFALAADHERQLEAARKRRGTVMHGSTIVDALTAIVHAEAHDDTPAPAGSGT